MIDPMQSASAKSRGASKSVRAGHLDDSPSLSLFAGTAPDEACHRRDDGMAAADANEDIRIRSALRSAIERWAAAGLEFTADDVRAEVGVGNPKAVGPAFAAAAKAGLIECVGATASRQASRHGGLSRIWRGTGVR